jgi:hypothetical protein
MHHLFENESNMLPEACTASFWQCQRAWHACWSLVGCSLMARCGLYCVLAHWFRPACIHSKRSPSQNVNSSVLLLMLQSYSACILRGQATQPHQCTLPSVTSFAGKVDAALIMVQSTSSMRHLDDISRQDAQPGDQCTKYARGYIYMACSRRL